MHTIRTEAWRTDGTLPPPAMLATDIDPLNGAKARAGLGVSLSPDGGGNFVPGYLQPGVANVLGGTLGFQLDLALTRRFELGLRASTLPAFGNAGVQLKVHLLHTPTLQLGVTGGVAAALAEGNLQWCQGTGEGTSCETRTAQPLFVSLAPHVAFHASGQLSDSFTLGMVLRHSWSRRVWSSDEALSSMSGDSERTYIEPMLALTYALGERARVGAGVGLYFTGEQGALFTTLSASWRFGSSEGP